jgi:hypothetical protein
MRKDTTAAPAQADAGEEHHLVAELRAAMARKDIITMGRMLELLGTIRGELTIGKPVIDGSAGQKSEVKASSAPAKARNPGPSGVPAARVTR